MKNRSLILDFGIKFNLVLGLSLICFQVFPTSWSEIKKTGKGDVTLHYYDSDNFIVADQSGNLSGLEYEIFMDFVDFLVAEYDIQLEPKIIRAKGFGELYQKINSGKPGDFGACSFSITPERKKEVRYAPAYMPDIEVLINSNNMPVVKDSAVFIKSFSKATALNVPNTTFDEDLKWLKNFLPNMKIQDMELASDVRRKIATESDFYGYVELPTYLVSLKNGITLKRQNWFKVEREGYAFIYPQNSDWTNPVELYFTSPRFRKRMNELIKKYFGADVNDLLWKISESQVTHHDEIALLTKEREIQALELEKKELKIRERQVWMNMLIGGIAVVIIIAFLLFNQNRIKQTANRLLSERNNEILNQKLEIETNRDDIEKKKKIIEVKNKDITASLNYAKLIQDVMLPDRDVLTNRLKSHFVFYRPRDIVSGDFYWWTEVKDTLIWVLADCTGHGVPGAFISMMGHNYLSQIVLDNDITTPADAVHQLDQMIIKALSGDTNQQSMNLGMELIMCAWTKGENRIVFSGSKHSVFHISSSSGEITETKGGKFPVGDQWFENKIYENKELHFESGDWIYMTSDGFPDQFGGIKGKKYKLSSFKKLLVEIHESTQEQQLTSVENEFDNWKGDLEQIDDICVLGFQMR